MKRLITIVLFTFFSFGMIFASWGAEISMGILSTIGITYNLDCYEFGAKYNTTFGVGGILSNAFLDKISDTNLSPEEKTKIGNNLIQGLTLDAFYNLVDTDHFRINIGPEISAYHISCKEGVFSHFTKADAVIFNIDSQLILKFNSKHSAYLNIGAPLLAYLNYGGEENNHNYLPFDFWAFIPTTVKQVEAGGWSEGLGEKVALAMLALNLRIGYNYRF